MEVEWLILADAAQIVGGKLYLLGGGWTVLTAQAGFPVQQHCGIAAAFTVPWTETNQRHDVEIEISDEDGRQTLWKQAGQVEVGRPPGIPLGSDQRAQIAVDLVLSFESAGTYVILVRVDGQEGRRTSFQVVPGPGVAARK
ncbi:MAG: hypothetical protein HY690_10590 [Chloroflexi bacterium]|nr:hypothetical protein [Chloroflexota bacterium]